MYVINSFAKIQQIANIPNYKIIFRITKKYTHIVYTILNKANHLCFKKSVVFSPEISHKKYTPRTSRSWSINNFKR